MKDQVDGKLGTQKEVLDKVREVTSASLTAMHEEIQDIRERIKNEVKNLKEENNGFMREL